jgi:hypothetical protein
MLDIILKAPVFDRLEKASRLPGAHKHPYVKKIIKRLKDPNDNVAQIALDMGFYSDAAHAVHLQQHWLNQPPNPQAFWGGIDTPTLMRLGLLKACEVFQKYGLPFEFFWVMSGAATTNDWEVTVSLCDKSTLVVFHTPRVPCQLPMKASKTMWVTLDDPVAGVIQTRPVNLPVDPLFPKFPSEEKPPRKSSGKKKPAKKKAAKKKSARTKARR